MRFPRSAAALAAALTASGLGAAPAQAQAAGPPSSTSTLPWQNPDLAPPQNPPPGNTVTPPPAGAPPGPAAVPPPNAPPPLGTVSPIRGPSRPECREFQQTITIGGTTQEAYGTTCLQPDGSWKVMGAPQSQQSPPPAQIAAPYPYYYPAYGYPPAVYGGVLVRGRFR